MARQIYLQSFINNATYHSMNRDADVTYKTVNLFSSDKCFTYFISDVPHYIRTNQHSTICTILVKVDILDTCTQCMSSNDVFVLSNRISAIFYEDKKYCLHIFPKQHALLH